MKKQKANKYIVKCPECGKKAKITGTPMVNLQATLFTTFLLSFTLILLICPPLGATLGCLSLIGSLLSPLLVRFSVCTVKCKHCNTKFKLSNKEYKEMKLKNN